MANDDFSNLEFYDKLKYMCAICQEVERKLKNITNEAEAWRYINTLMDTLIENFHIFLLDEELNNKDNIGDDYATFSRNIRSVLDIAPLVKSGDANFRYLFGMLSSLSNIIENIFPKNIKLVRLFKELLNSEEQISQIIDVDVDSFDIIIKKMIKNADLVDDVLSKNSSKIR